LFFRTIAVCFDQTRPNHRTKGRRTVEWKLEVVPVPVTDVDRAKRRVDAVGERRGEENANA
jgi:hypothetical protein